MSTYNVQAGSLPTWHKDYVKNSTTYVDAFAKNPRSKFSKVSSYFTSNNQKYLSLGLSKNFNMYSGHFTDPYNGLVYKGCGLLYETTKTYTNGWTIDNTTGFVPAKGTSSYESDKCFHIVWNKGTLTMYRATDGASCPIKSNQYMGDGYTQTWYNVPPLIYFEFVAGGGGGAGAANYGTGGGGGGGAGCCGLLNFTSSEARTYGYYLKVGSSGYGSTGAFDPNSSTPGWTKTPNGGNGKACELRLNTSARYPYVYLNGGGGGKGRVTSQGTAPSGGAGGKAVRKVYAGSSTVDATFTNNTFIDSTTYSIYILRSFSGCGGTSGYISNTLVTTPSDFTATNITLDSSLILNSLPKQTYESNDPASNDNIQTGGGYGGPSMLGAGGQSGTADRFPTTPSGYGGGGGGNKAGSDVVSGCPGAKARFIMRWVPYS